MVLNLLVWAGCCLTRKDMSKLYTIVYVHDCVQLSLYEFVQANPMCTRPHNKVHVQ